MKSKLLLIIVALHTITLFDFAGAHAQTPTAFTYQGRLTEAGAAAEGTYDLQFKLYDDAGTQIGATLMRDDVEVRAGVFSVTLNFNLTAFPGDNRKLEIAVRRGAETGVYTTLAPRQSVTSAPYAMRATNATNSENAMYAVNATQAAQAGEALTAQNSLQLGGTPAGQYVQTGSTEFVRNRTMQQTSTNFNIDGIGGASIFSAGTQFNIGSNRILGNAGTDNLFVGIGAGEANTQGENNSFVGKNAGQGNTQGVGNAFFGRGAGFSNTTGSNNTAIGQGANFGSNNLTFATVLGAGANVYTNNTVVLGRTADDVVIPGNLNIIGNFNATFNVPASSITGVLPLSKGGTGLSSPGAAGRFLRSNGTSFTSSPLQGSDVPAGSASYLQNTTTQQAATNFNISGNGTAGGTITAATLSASVVNTSAQYNLNGFRVLSNAGLDNLFVGVDAGTANAGVGNSFFGKFAGKVNSMGGANSFVGANSGQANTSGNNNAFFGSRAGEVNSTGNYNTFFGGNSGRANTTGSYSIAIGYNANSGSNLTYATALGSGAVVSTSNTVMLGRVSDTVEVPGSINIGNNATAGGTLTADIVKATTGINLGDFRILSTAGTDNLFAGRYAGTSNTTGRENSFFGTNAGFYNTDGIANSFFGIRAGEGNKTGDSNAFFGNYAGSSTNTGSFNTFIGAYAGDENQSGSNNTLIGRSADVANPVLTYATAIGSGSVVNTSNTIALGREIGYDNVVVYGQLQLNGFGVGGNTPLCKNAANEITYCSSSLRYKTNIAPFSFGLSLINQLRPIAYEWKQGGMKDVGFGAEDVARINPLFVTYNKAGEIEGVKYDRLSVAFVNAFKEQQAQIESQQTQIEAQQKQMDELKQIVCSLKPDAAVCRETNK